MNTLAPFFAFSLALVGITFPTSSLLQAQTVTPTSTAYSFGNIDICPAGKATPAPCSANHTVSFNVAAGTTIGGIAIVLGGAPGLDFKAEADDTSTALCTAKLYTEATTCTVDVTFAPIAPGARNGAVEIVGGNGLVLATSYVYGIGVGPQIAFSPATQAVHSIGGIGIDPYASAIDGGGDLFLSVATASGGAVEELTAASDYNSATVLTTIVNVLAMAVDGAGNLFLLDRPYVNDPGVQEVRELFAAGNYTSTRILIEDARFSGIAIDGGGNLFFTGSDDFVHEYLAAGGYTTVKTRGNKFGLPVALAVDGSENIFVADAGRNAVYEVLATGGYATTRSLKSDIFEPVAIAVDAADNVVVAAGAGLLQIVAAGGYTTVNTLFHTAGVPPYGAVVDGYGNVFTAPPAVSTTIVELRRSQPPSLQFAPTTVDSTGNASSSATAQNIGNATLTVSTLAFTNAEDFAHATSSGIPPDCTGSSALAPGAECNLSVDFTPETAGSLSGSLNLTDNALNAAAATQAIVLSGNGIAAGGPVAHVSATALNYGSVAYPGTATQSLTITNTGGGKLTIGPSVTSLNFTVTSNTCGGGVTTGSCVLQVEFTPTSIGSQPNHLTLATNGPTNPVVALNGTATGVGAILPFNPAYYGGLYPLEALSFGTIYFPSTSNLQEFFVYDAGVPGPVTVRTSINGPDYQVTTNSCLGPGVAASGYCIVEVEFLPLSLGGHYEHLTLTPSSGSPSTIELIGTAAGIVP